MTLPVGWPGLRRRKLAVGLRKWPASRAGGSGPPVPADAITDPRDGYVGIPITDPRTGYENTIITYPEGYEP